MRSVWQEDRGRERPQLEGSVSADVCVIGGGIAGILCAYMLKEAGVDCVLVEAGRICEGVTGGTTAKITLQHGLIYDGLTNRFGYDGAYLYAEAQRRGLADYSRLAKEYPCDFERRDSFVYSTDSRGKLEREVAAMHSIGIRAELTDAPEIPITVAGAVRVPDQAQLHPLKLLYALAEGLKIYEGTRVTELAHGRVKAENGEISCRAIVVATHFPILNKHGSYFLKMYQHRSYFLALEGADRLRGMYVDEDHKGMSFREYGGKLLLGGGGHRTGKRGGAWRELEDFASKHYPRARITHRWAAQDCMTLDGMPYIGRYSASTDDLYVATGFNKWGLSSSMVASHLLTDLLLGRSNDYAEIFSPSRSILHPRLVLNTVETVLNLLTPTAPRCPHLGCALKYNRAEHSWDCPCHGSRFAEDGELLDGPATADKMRMPRKD